MLLEPDCIKEEFRDLSNGQFSSVIGDQGVTIDLQNDPTPISIPGPGLGGISKIRTCRFENITLLNAPRATGGNTIVYASTVLGNDIRNSRFISVASIFLDDFTGTDFPRILQSVFSSFEEILGDAVLRNFEQNIIHNSSFVLTANTEIFKNNIITSDSSLSLSSSNTCFVNNDIDFNIFEPGCTLSIDSIPTVITSKAVLDGVLGFVSNNIVASAQFVNPSLFNFSVPLTSPALGNGDGQVNIGNVSASVLSFVNGESIFDNAINANPNLEINGLGEISVIDPNNTTTGF